MPRPRSRRALLTSMLPLTMVFTGCFNGRTTSTDKVTHPDVIPADEYDCADVDRPDPEALRYADGLEPTPYPSPPDSPTDDVEQYVFEFEEAYRRNALIAQFGSDTQAFDFRLEAWEVDEIDAESELDAVLMAVVYDAIRTTSRQDDRREYHTRVTYYLDENVVLRARYDGAATGPAFDPDPRRSGDLVACSE